MKRARVWVWGALLVWSVSSFATDRRFVIVDSQFVTEPPRGYVQLSGGVLMEMTGPGDEGTQYALYLVVAIKGAAGDNIASNLGIWDAKSGKRFAVGGAWLPKIRTIPMREAGGYTGVVVPILLGDVAQVSPFEGELYATWNDYGQTRRSQPLILRASVVKGARRETPRAWVTRPEDDPNILMAFANPVASQGGVTITQASVISYSSAPGPDAPAALAYGIDFLVRVDSSLLPFETLSIHDARTSGNSPFVAESVQPVPGDANLFRVNWVLRGEPTSRFEPDLYAKVSTSDGKLVHSNEGTPDAYFTFSYDLAAAIRCPVALSAVPNADRALTLRPLVGDEVGLRLGSQSE